MSGSIRKNIRFFSAVILVIFVLISFVSSCLIVRLTSAKYQASVASAALDMAELTINADLAKETFSTRAVSDEFLSTQTKLTNYQKRNSSAVKRISLVSFSNTSGGYIYDTGGRSLGDRLDYDDYTSSIKTELINGRNPLEHTVGGITVAYFRPLRTVDDNLCGYIIVELAKPYELAYFPVLVCVLAALFVLSALFIFIFMRALNRRLFTPIKRITDSAVYLSGDDSASVGQDASVFFETTRNDEVGKLSKALQDIFFNMNSRNENLSQALYDANHDGMTGLFNKRCYHSMVEVFKSCECICLIYFDVNNLKLMNDTLGHESGDYVITSAADYIKGIMKPTDYTFRMGGDEFLMVMTQCSYRSINDLIERLEKESPIILSKPTDSIKCALSFGYAYAKGEYDYDKKLAEAEENMYEKKAALKKELQMPDR